MQTVVVGGGMGLIGAALLVVPLRRYWIPDSLQNAVSLAAVFAVFSIANHCQAESGLLAVTVMGIGLANQRWVAIKHLTEFKENLTVLLISGLFIILAARLRTEDIVRLDARSFAFVAVLVLVARPAAVLLSTVKSKLSWRERLFLCGMAPRGIVAAAVASVFALELSAAGSTQAERLVPLTFLVILGTVLLYGLSAAPLARRLGLARPNAQGVIFVGAHEWARAVAMALRDEGCPVLMVDSDRTNVAAARLAGLPVQYGSILAEHTVDVIEFGGLGRLVALTANHEVNSLACLRYIEYFGRQEVYQLPFDEGAEGRHEAVSREQRGRILFGRDTTFDRLIRFLGERPAVKVTRLTKVFDYQTFRDRHGDSLLPLFLITERGTVEVFATDGTPMPRPGQVLVSLSRESRVPPAGDGQSRVTD